MDELPVPQPLEPVSAPGDDGFWATAGMPKPSGAAGAQSSDGSSTHSLWPSDVMAADRQAVPGAARVPPQIAERHPLLDQFEGSADQRPRESVVAPMRSPGPQDLPPSDIWGFNGVFPGPMINARYGQPGVVRFKNELVKGPVRPESFGSPDGQCLTHLHNGHTAPDSDGNPHFRPDGYKPREWVDSLYLNYPAGGDDNEKQAFLWFHDHFEAYTGANVYKELVGLHPI
jgi:hypothetical protein